MEEIKVIKYINKPPPLGTGLKWADLKLGLSNNSFLNNGIKSLIDKKQTNELKNIIKSELKGNCINQFRSRYYYILRI